MPASTSRSRSTTRSKCSGLVYLQAYFVTIATILGTGILGLPVTLKDSGLYPFLVTFLIDALVQSFLVHLFVDILQRACLAQQQVGKINKEESVPLNSMLEDDLDLESDDSDDDEEHANGNNTCNTPHDPLVEDGSSQVHFTGAIMKGKMLHIRELPPIEPPNLHLVGKLFLTCGLQQAFDFIILLQFLALLICYALAGSEALAQLIDTDHIYIIPFYSWSLTFAIVFGLQVIQPIVSILTFFKGSLLVATTMVTFYVGVQVKENIQTDFTQIGGPFLMGTVALGGVVNTMPYTFEKIQFKRDSISKYRTAIQLGMWTCVVLNIFWSWAVLEIVPQTVELACIKERLHLQDYLPSNASSQDGMHACHGKLSLQSAKDNGEISTLPLTKILEREHPSFTWVAILVEIFILVSITVSYLTIGSAYHHTISGIVQSFGSKKEHGRSKVASRKCGKWLATTALSLASFAVVFGVAMLDPEGFVNILEKLVSFSINIEVGVFVFIMVIVSRIKSYRSIEVPLPMSQCLVPMAFILPLFFNFAVVYDVYESIQDFLHPSSIQPVLWNVTEMMMTMSGNRSSINTGGSSIGGSGVLPTVSLPSSPSSSSFIINNFTLAPSIVEHSTTTSSVYNASSGVTTGS